MPEALIDAFSAAKEGRLKLCWSDFFLCRNIILSTQKHWARHLVVVPGPMPAAPRKYLIVAARRLTAAVVCHRCLIVVPRLLPAAPLLVRRRYLIVVPRPLPAAPLVVRRTHLAVVLRPVLRPLPAVTRRCRIRRRTTGR